MCYIFQNVTAGQTCRTLQLVCKVVVVAAAPAVDEGGAGAPLLVEAPPHQLFVTLALFEWVGKAFT